MGYRLIGIDKGLRGRMLERYVVYMRARWPELEELSSNLTYAIEWAHRFQEGVEWYESDTAGQEILRGMGCDGY